MKVVCFRKGNQKKIINTAIICIANPPSGKTTQGIPKLTPLLEYG
jgi:hypothetical protein